MGGTGTGSTTTGDGGSDGTTGAAIVEHEVIGGGAGTPLPYDEDVIVTANVTGVPPTILDVDVKVSVLCINARDIRVFIRSPEGTRVELASGNGGQLDDYIDTVFDDEAPDHIWDGSPPYTGSYRPEEPLSALDGENVNGVWQLEVSATPSGGTLVGWELRFDLQP